MTDEPTTTLADSGISTPGEGSAVAEALPAPEIVARGPTVEQGLYALLLLLALGLRLYGLGSLDPISPWEAAKVWPAWSSYAAGLLEENLLPESGPAASPLLSTLQQALFFLTGGGSAFWARFAPACAGAGMVLAAWTLRGRLGREGALMAALLFAFDPWILSFSRMADSAALSLLTGVLLLSGLFDGGDRRRQVTRLAVVAGLYLISGPLAWLLLPVVLLAFALLRGGPFGRLEGGKRGRAALICIGTVVIGSTGLLANIGGLAGIGEGIEVAIEHLVRPLAGDALPFGDLSYPLNWALLRLLVDEPFVLLFGGIGLAVALFRLADSTKRVLMRSDVGDGGYPAEQQRALSVAWLRTVTAGVGWGLLLVLLPGRTPVSLLVAGLPLLLLAAETAATGLRMSLSPRMQMDDGRVPALVTMAILLVTAYFWTGNTTAALRDGAFDTRQVIFYLLIPALGAFFVWWSGARASGQVFALLAFAILFLAQASSSWMLSLRPDSGHSRSLFAEVGSGSLPLLLDDVARLSSLRAGDRSEATVHLHVRTTHLPYFAWHFRAMRNLRWQPGVDLSQLEEDAIIISQQGVGGQVEQVNLPAGFIGSSYTVTDRWLPTDLVGIGPYLRWMLYRERQEGPEDLPARQKVELWVQRE